MHARIRHLINEANEELDRFLFSDSLLASALLSSKSYPYQSSLHPFKYSLLISCPDRPTQGLFLCVNEHARARVCTCEGGGGVI